MRKPNTRGADPENYAYDLVYGSNLNNRGATETLRLDIHWPATYKNDSRRFPLIVLIHGGSFINGDKKGFRQALQQLADSGFVAVSINYRLGWNIPKATTMGCDVDLSDNINAVYRAMQDTHAALRYLVCNSKKYHIDTNWIFVGGRSAGAITALMATYGSRSWVEKNWKKTVAQLGTLDQAGNSLKATYRIKGVCDMWGALPDSAMITPDNAVPSLLYHGTADKIIPYDFGKWRTSPCPDFPNLYGSACIFRQLNKYKVPIVFTTIVGGKHGPAELNNQVTAANAACFFHSVINNTAESKSLSMAHPGCIENMP